MDNQLLHIVHHHAVVEYRGLEALSKPHDVAQVDGDISLPCKFQNKSGTVVAAGGGIENQTRIVLDEEQCLRPAGEHHRRNQR